MAELSFNVSDELQKEIEGMFVKAAREVLAEVTKQELNSKQYFNQKEAAEWLSVSVNTIRQYETMGLRTSRINGKKFFGKDSIIEFLKIHES